MGDFLQGTQCTTSHFSLGQQGQFQLTNFPVNRPPAGLGGGEEQEKNVQHLLWHLAELRVPT